MVEKGQRFRDLCCVPAIAAVSLVPLPPESQALLPRTPFILAPLSLKRASRCQAQCDLWIKFRHLSVPFKRQKEQTHAHINQDGLLFKNGVCGGCHPPVHRVYRINISHKAVLCLLRTAARRRGCTPGARSRHGLEEGEFSSQEFRAGFALVACMTPP